MTALRVVEPKEAADETAETEAAEPDRRRSPRYQTRIDAFVPSERGGDMPCRILNVSDTGALLKPQSVLLCPSQFVLKPEAGEPRKCEVVWTNGEMLAVRFVGENAPALGAREWAALGSEPVAEPDSNADLIL